MDSFAGSMYKDKPVKAGLFQQFYILLYKQSLLLRRNKVITFIRFTFPFWMILIYFIIGRALDQQSKNETFSPKPLIFDYKTNCDYHLMYKFVNMTTDTSILNRIASNLNLELGTDIVEAPTQYGSNQITMMTNILTSTSAKTSFASVFFEGQTDNTTYYNLAFYNNDQQLKNTFIFDFSNFYGITEESTYAYAMRTAIEDALVGNYTNYQSSITVGDKQAPTVLGQSGGYPAGRVFTLFFPIFLWFGVTFPFLLFVYLIVEEKERKIRSYLRAFGVNDTIYFAAWVLDGLLVTFVNTIILMIFGAATETLTFLHNTNATVLFITLMSYGFSLSCLGVLISSLLSRTKAAMIIIVIIFCLTLGASIVLSLLGDLFYAIYSSKIKYYAWLTVFIVLTPLNILKVFEDITLKVSNMNLFDQFDQTIQPIAKYFWPDFTANIDITLASAHITTTYASVSYIFLVGVFYLLIGFYFDKIIPDDFGARKHPLFFLTYQFWFPTNYPDPVNPSDLVGRRVHNQDPDVEMESRQVPLDQFDNYSLVVRDLVKCYGPKRVVDHLNLTAERGQIVALLGHNGSGKTTTINAVTGQTTITSGNAYLMGFNVVNQIDQVRQLIGITPQFDVYWPDFTAREHLTIMALVKEKRHNIKHDVDEILKSVRLANVADNAVSSYSGGMRRRLSVAMGIIGNPQVVILDEPTTGIDPANRRYIWKLIKSIKKDKLILLTSHSTDETEQLADKIIIMDHGKLICSGTSLHLKSRYGSGYKLHLVSSNIEAAKQMVFSKIPSSSLLRVNSNNLVFNIPSMDLLSTLINELTQQKNPDISDWQIVQTSLEDIFLQLSSPDQQVKK